MASEIGNYKDKYVWCSAAGSEFTAYYTNGNGVADETRPVVDVNGQAVVLYPGTANDEFQLIPEDYISGGVLWKISFVENRCAYRL